MGFKGCDNSLPGSRVYEEAASGRSTPHHLQVKVALWRSGPVRFGEEDN
jgi:hypothetical protein